MRVALVTDWFHPRIGGLELHLQDLGARLTAAGHEVVVITPTPGADRVDGLRVRRVSAALAPHFGFLATSSGVRALGDAIAEERVDVAHCHVSIVSPAGFGGAREAERRGVPAVVTFHSIVPQTGVLARAASAAFATRRWRVRFSAVSQRVARDVDAVSPSKISILPNGIDVDFWRTVPSTPVDDVVRLVSVMRLNAKKRPLALVSLMRHVRELAPAARVQLTVVGDGPQRDALARAVARHGLNECVELLGWRSRDEIRALFARSDVFVLPTVRESFGLAALEARCAGLPVVAMKASGVAELITHEREGLLASGDDELACHVASLASDPARRKSIADHNRGTTPPYDWSRVVDAHLALYREAIALRTTV